MIFNKTYANLKIRLSDFIPVYSTLKKAVEEKILKPPLLMLSFSCFLKTLNVKNFIPFLLPKRDRPKIREIFH